MKKTLLFTSTLFALLLAACGAGAASETEFETDMALTIDAPQAGSEIAAGAPLAIRWSAIGRTDIAAFEVLMNGESIATLTDVDHSNPLIIEALEWTPPEVGDYHIEVLAAGEDGATQAAAEVRVTAVESDELAAQASADQALEHDQRLGIDLISPADGANVRSCKVSLRWRPLAQHDWDDAAQMQPLKRYRVYMWSATGPDWQDVVKDLGSFAVDPDSTSKTLQLRSGWYRWGVEAETPFNFFWIRTRAFRINGWFCR